MTGLDMRLEFILNDGKPFGCEKGLDLTLIHSRQSRCRSTESSSEASTKPSAIRVPGRGQRGMR